MKTLDQSFYNEIKRYAIDQLNDGRGEGVDTPDLHHELFNMDYFIIGHQQAKEWLGNSAFDAIGLIVEYEKENFGEVSTDLSEPEKVANMVSYVLGEEILSEEPVRTYLDDRWEEKLTEKDLKKIIKLLKEQS